MRTLAAVSAIVVVTAACGDTAAETTSTTSPEPGPTTGQVDAFGGAIPPAPEWPTGPLDPQVISDLDTVFADLAVVVDLGALERLGESGDPRVAWLLSDLLRFFQGGEVAEVARFAFERLTDTKVRGGFVWGIVTDWLIAWDVPAPPGYVTWKAQLFELIEPAWAPFFADPDADVDWRWISWGGVRIDDRPLDQVAFPCPEGCIPALDDPAVTDAAGGDWYPDDALVFGVVVDGEARAYPKNIMEIHEMVNDTLGGRRIGVPYCTLCGSAQAYFTDTAPGEPAELRTTGLLSRSNKVMFDFHTWSLFDTFTGGGLSGPLQGTRLEMVSVRTATWADWRDAHPDTTIVARDGGIGRSYPLDPLQGRDDDGPIFPVGDVDTRLPVQEQVIGVIASDGTPLAFPAASAQRALEAGDEVSLGGVALILEDGIAIATADGGPLVSHQAFWFAWSQFHPETLVWVPLGG